ncbi:MAG: hemerythrin domain-containing protein [Bacteroidetes bacterium]|nr:hemerythrin domain-containing protein [Bacteroidota bacterium]
MQIKNYDTVTEALAALNERGYTHDFSVADGEDCIVCHKHQLKLSPDDFSIDEFYRFEGQSDPGDEMIVYALSSDKFKIKGTIVNAFGIYADDVSDTLIEKLSVKMKGTTTPIKRSKALIQFSREHHFALLLVWKIRQGLRKNIPAFRISNYIQFYFDNALNAHFKNEEKELFTLLPENDPLRQQAFLEHENIQAMLSRIQKDNNNSALLTEFADTLERHIRFEERTLFGHLQNCLSAEEIKFLEENHQSRQGDIDDNWNDHFWVIN